jgi:hypothetical protein
MASLSGDDIAASVSAQGLGAGRHQLRPRVTLPPEVQWLRTEPEIVVVNLEPVAAEPEPTPTAPTRRTAASATPTGE